MRKILGIAVLAISLMSGATIVLAQSSRDVTEPTGTEANRLRTQYGPYTPGSYGYAYFTPGYYGYAYSPRLHRRWYWSHRRW